MDREPESGVCVVGRSLNRWAGPGGFSDDLDDGVDIASVVEDFIHVMVPADECAEPLLVRGRDNEAASFQRCFPQVLEEAPLRSYGITTS